MVGVVAPLRLLLQVVVLTGVRPAECCCLSGLFCEGESSIDSLEGRALWLDATTVTMSSVLLQGLSGDFVLSAMLRGRLVECVSVSVWLQGGGEEVAGTCGTSTASSWDGCDWSVGGGGQSRVSKSSCGLRGEIGVGGPEDLLCERIVAC